MWTIFFLGFFVGVSVCAVALVLLLYRFLLKSSAKAHKAADQLAHRKEPTTRVIYRRTGITREGEHGELYESSEWLNRLSQRLFKEVLRMPGLKEKIMELVTNKINAIETPSVLGEILIEDLDIGDQLPQIEGVKSVVNNHSLEMELEINYSGGVYFAVSTELWINWPQYHVASLPISLNLTLVNLHAKARLTCPSEVDPVCVFAFVEEPQMEFHIGSSIGYERPLKDLPKVGELITQQLARALRQEVVLPNAIAFHLPIMGHKIDLQRIKNFAQQKEKEKEKEKEKTLKDKSIFTQTDEIESALVPVAGSGSASSKKTRGGAAAGAVADTDTRDIRTTTGTTATAHEPRVNGKYDQDKKTVRTGPSDSTGKGSSRDNHVPRNKYEGNRGIHGFIFGPDGPEGAIAAATAGRRTGLNSSSGYSSSGSAGPASPSSGGGGRGGRGGGGGMRRRGKDVKDNREQPPPHRPSPTTTTKNEREDEMEEEKTWKIVHV